jgi:hypothetical protein
VILEVVVSDPAEVLLDTEVVDSDVDVGSSNVVVGREVVVLSVVDVRSLVE